MALQHKINPKYYAGLTNKNTKLQKMYISQSKRNSKKGVFLTRPTLASYKQKKSPHVVNFKKIYGISIQNNKGIKQLLDIPTSTQKMILKKGRGAYFSSGSRPGQTPSSWAYARLASALLGRSACKVNQHILLPKSCKELRTRTY
jgi:hypothetical protein